MKLSKSVLSPLANDAKKATLAPVPFEILERVSTVGQTGLPVRESIPFSILSI